MAESAKPDGGGKNEATSSRYRWWRGWFRLAALLYVAAWGATWVWLIRDTAKKAESLLFPHLDPSWLNAPWDGDWCVVAATPDFVALSPDAQRMRAAAFYDSELADLAKGLYYDPVTFRQQFIRASAEAPINKWINQVQYRDMTAYGYPPRLLGLLTRDAALLGLALWAAVVVPLFVIVSALRWVARGFTK